MSFKTPQRLKSAALATGLALLLVNGAAFAAPQPPREQGAPHAMMDPQRVDQKLASLKSDLKITEAQTPAWNGVADAMRANANAMRTAAEARKAGGAQSDALKRLEAMDARAKLRAQSADRLLTAFRPLYAQLNDEQRQVAAQKFVAPHHKRGMEKKAG